MSWDFIGRFVGTLATGKKIGKPGTFSESRFPAGFPGVILQIECEVTMQYFLCPRCNFKVPGNRRSCNTCGYEVPKAAGSSVVEEDSKTLNKKSAVWSKFLGFSQQDQKRDKNPALG
jgi:hypothetical protein